MLCGVNAFLFVGWSVRDDSHSVVCHQVRTVDTMYGQADMLLHGGVMSWTRPIMSQKLIEAATDGDG
jgi:hypothetical protein